MSTAEHYVSPASLPAGAKLLPSGSDYQRDPKYIDNISRGAGKGGHLDLVSGAFWIDHDDGTIVYLDYVSLWRDFNPEPRSFGLAVTREPRSPSRNAPSLWRYWRHPNGKIYPSKFTKQTTPNIYALCQNIEGNKGERVETLMALKLVITVFGLSGASAATTSGTAGKPTVRNRANKVGVRGRGTARIPQLAPDHPGAMIKEALSHVDDYAGSTAEKADLFEHLLEQVRRRNLDWGFVRTQGMDGSEIFFGQGGPHVAVISPQGRVYTGNMSRTPNLFTRMGDKFQPNYANFLKTAKGVTDLK